MPSIRRIQKNLANNILVYSLLAMVIGLITGYYYDLKKLSSLITPTVLIMIYPMMVNLSLSHLKKIGGVMKPLLEAMVLNFIIAPLLMYVLVILFHAPLYMKTALLLLSIAPASSMGLGYVGLAEGDMLTGATIVATAFILSLIAFPLAGYLLTSGTELHVPISLIVKNLLLILVTPLTLGVLTREYIERGHGSQKYMEVKPYFSTITLLGLYTILYLIFASKAKLVVSHYKDLLLLTPIALLFYGAILFLLLWLNPNVFGLEYGQHQSVVFTTVSKNVALTIAILISVFGKNGAFMAVYPAIMALFQTPILVTYLKYSDKVKYLFRKLEKEVEEIVHVKPQQ